MKMGSKNGARTSDKTLGKNTQIQTVLVRVYKIEHIIVMFALSWQLKYYGMRMTMKMITFYYELR